MSKKEDYLKDLKDPSRWDKYLLEHSNLPGPRGNLELMQAFIEVGNEESFVRYTGIGPSEGPVGDPREFLAFCGTVGLGKLIAAGKLKYYESLRKLASDSRWRIREGVAWALQICGEHDFDALIDNCISWARGGFLEQRALAAGLSHPSLLKPLPNAIRALAVLDHVTRSISEVENRKDEDFRTLRKGLGYCWSVVIAAHPEAGKPVFRDLLGLEDPDVRWIMKENLRKNQLVRMDRKWTESMLLKLEQAK